MIVFASVIKAENNTFIDVHFVRDSVLVLINGVVVSSLIEGICLNTCGLPARHSEFFCKLFAPEAATFVYLAKSNWPADALEIWSCLNMALFAYLFITNPKLGLSFSEMSQDYAAITS